MITSVNFTGIYPHNDYEVFVFGGHRNPLATVPWNEGLARLRYRLHLRLTLGVGEEVFVTARRMNSGFESRTYDGPLTNEYATPELLLAITEAPTGLALNGCDPPVDEAHRPQAHGWRVGVRTTRSSTSATNIVHGALVEIVNVDEYNAPPDAATASHFELADRQAIALPYDCVDSWQGQMAAANTLTRLTFEARPICYVPFYGEGPP